MRTLLCRALALALLVSVSGIAARADDEEAAEKLVLRLFDVGALTSGRSDFLRARGAVVDPDDVADEESPLFGAEYEEPLYPVGQVDELIELILREVRPETWESTLGAGIRSQGEGMLVVRCFQDVLDDVAAYLATLERRLMRRVAVDVASLSLTDAEARAALRDGSDVLLDPARLEALRTGPRAGPSFSLLLYERNRAVIFSGAQQAYVQDFDVEVCEDASVSDPIIGVANLGLSASVQATLGPDARSVLLEVSADLSRLREMATLDAGERRILELPDLDLVNVETRIELPVGAWALLEGSSRGAGAEPWYLAVRATALAPEGLGERPQGVALDSPGERPARRLESRVFDVAMLCQTVPSRLGETVNLVPSNFTPPSPPELAEPAALFPAESLVELIRESIVPNSWDLAGAWIEARGGFLHVRNAPEILRAVEQRLQVLRREFVWTLVHEGQLIEVPAVLGFALESAPGRVLGDGERARLDEALRSGEARSLGTVRVSTMNGARNAVSAGRRVQYLGDFEVEIAKGAPLSNPVIRSVVSGMGLDVESLRTSGGEAMQSTLRFVRTDVHMPLRRASTPLGDVQAPEMDMLRVQTVFEAPLGRTLVVAGAGDGARRQLLLLRATLQRSSE